VHYNKLYLNLNRSARQVQLEEEYRPAKPVVITTSVTQAVKPDGSTYPVPVRSHYSGPNPVWTDYTGKTRELPSPLPAATRPVATTYYSPTRQHIGITREQPPAWCGVFAGIPMFGWIAGLIIICTTGDEVYTTNFKFVAVTSMLISILCMVSASANSKPLTSYQLEPAQSVSSLIK